MAQYYIQGSTLEALGDVIREKTGTSAKLSPMEMVNAISNMGGTAKWEGELATNSEGVLTFPQFSFQPKTFVVSNLTPFYEFEDGTSAYTGFMATAIYDETLQRWFEQIPHGSYGKTILGDASWDSRNAILIDDSGNYSFDLLARRNNSSIGPTIDELDRTLENLIFKCRVYG